VPSVQHLHGEAVALGDPSDQDIVRSRLCRTQWPSRKVGRIGLAGGSMGKARFCTLSQEAAGICDVPHRCRFPDNRRDGANELKQRIGTIIQKRFLPVHATRSTIARLGQQNSTRPAGAPTPLPGLRRGASPRPNPAKFHCQTREIATLGAPKSVPKDTKPKGFPT